MDDIEGIYSSLMFFQNAATGWIFQGRFEEGFVALNNVLPVEKKYP
jgi:hypothetical protein